MTGTETSNPRFVRRLSLLCCHCARNIAYHRMGYVSEDGTGTLKWPNQFGTTMTGNALDMAVLEWCKLFADRKAHHHWRRFVREAAAQHRFLGALRSQLQISETVWKRYVDEMRLYRDKFVAHLDTMNVMQIPRLQVALDATCFLYAHVRAIVPQDWFDSPHCAHLPADLRTYYDACCAEGRAAYAPR